MGLCLFISKMPFSGQASYLGLEIVTIFVTVTLKNNLRRPHKIKTSEMQQIQDRKGEKPY
jgi:hypothetical protein